MKRLSALFLILTFLSLGWAQNAAGAQAARVVDDPATSSAAPESSGAIEKPAETGPGTPSTGVPDKPETIAVPGGDAGDTAPEGDTGADGKDPGEGDNGEPAITIADPLEGYNRVMFQFNDKLYFWVLKPVAQGYREIVPEAPRVSVNNFFTNLAFPIRFVNHLLQADLMGAAAEAGRFVVNTVWGIGGLMDPASSKQLDIPKEDPDLGQTLGMYGVGQGFYFIWPFLGPSSARDSLQVVSDYFLYPVSYINPWYASTGTRVYQEVNRTSLTIGNYEALKEAAIDPYVALRDAYAQYRQKKVEAARGNGEPPRPGTLRVGQAERQLSIRQEPAQQERPYEKEKR
jgi:phospholipid-binding lipoprotein MlaA